MIHLRKYGVASEVYVPVITTGAADFKGNPTIAAGDFNIALDGVSLGTMDTLPTLTPAVGKIIKIPLSVAELSGETAIITLVDAAGAQWEDQMVVVETYGHASARHPFDLGTAMSGQAVSSVTGAVGSVTGACGSVTGAVGSVTGNVGGNVTGSVASVVADVNADVVKVHGDATSAENLELQYDTTGIVGDNFPATQAQVGAIGAVPGGALPFAADTDNTGGAIKGASFVGTETSGTFASTEAADGVYHIIDDAGGSGNIDIVYGFSVGGNRTAVNVSFEGFLNIVIDDVNIQAWDFVGSDWETRAILPGQGSSADITQVVTLLGKHTGTSGSDIGKVYVRFEGSGQSNPSLNTDELLVSAVQLGQTVGYADGAIWVNTNASNTNTENFVDGVADNPVSTWAAALTLSGQLGMVRFHIINGSTIQLSANSDNYTLIGDAWTLDLNSQSIIAFHASGADVTGAGTGGGGHPEFHDCHIGAATLPPVHLTICGLGGTLTANAAGDYFLDNCHSMVTGAGTPIFDFGAAVGNTNLNLRNYSGGIQLESMGDNGTDTASIEGRGQVVEGTCTGGAVAIRGLFTVSGITNLTLSDDARFSVDQLASVYEKAAVWLDTIGGVAGTQSFENGTMNNPVDSIADALTIAGNVGLTHIYVLPGSSFTLPASPSVDGFHFMGNRYVVDLGGQSVSGTIFDCAQVTGSDDGSNSLPTAYLNCLMNDNTLGAHQMINCGLGGDVTLVQTGMIDWIDCYSRIAGTATPSVDFGAALGNTNFNMRGYSGGIEVKNIGGAGTDNMSLEGHGQLVLNANCADGTIAIRGHFMVTDNVGGGFAGTLSDRVNFETLLDDGTAVYDRTTDSLQEIRDQVVTVDTVVDGIKTVTDALPDAGALNDLAAILADTNELQTDWTNAGRLDVILDAIKAVTDNLPESGALTTIGTDTARLTAARAQILTDWIDGGRLDLLLDATSTHNAAAVVTAMMANQTDGVTLTVILECVMAALFGVATVADDTVVFKKRDGSTTRLTVVVGDVAGERDSSTIA